MLSIEQPQVLQSPVHSPVKAWATVFECITSGVSGLNETIRYITIKVMALMPRFVNFMVCVSIC